MSWEDNCGECGASAEKISENENGEYECPDCGLILGLAIDMGKDYRVFADGAGQIMKDMVWLQHGCCMTRV